MAAKTKPLTERDRYLIELCKETAGYSVGEFCERFDTTASRIPSMRSKVNDKMRTRGEEDLPLPPGGWKRYDELHDGGEKKDPVNRRSLRDQVTFYKREYEELLKRVASDARFFQALERLIPVRPPRRVAKANLRTIGNDGEEAIALISDCHAGEVVTPEETGGFGRYNWGIFETYADYLGEQVPALLNEYGGVPDTLNAWFLGDIISGMIHEELSRTNEYGAIECCVKAAEILSEMVVKWSSVFKRVNCIGIFGNHGRIEKQKSYKGQFNNFDWITYYLMKALCRQAENIHWTIPKSFFYEVKILDQIFLLLHGDNIRMFYRTPYYGIDNAVKKLTTLLASKGRFLKYVCLAHFHRSAFLDKVSGEKIINGGWAGFDEFALGALMDGCEPKQSLMRVTREGITWRYPIPLQQSIPEEVAI